MKLSQSYIVTELELLQKGVVKSWMGPLTTPKSEPFGLLARVTVSDSSVIVSFFFVNKSVNKKVDKIGIETIAKLNIIHKIS